MATFKYDLGAGYELTQEVNDKGEETMTFARNGDKFVTLMDPSVKRLRDIFKKIGGGRYDG